MHVFSLEREQECNPKHHVEKAAHASAARRMNRPTQLHRRLKIRGGPEVGECHWTQVNGEMVPGAEPQSLSNVLLLFAWGRRPFPGASGRARGYALGIRRSLSSYRIGRCWSRAGLRKTGSADLRTLGCAPSIQPDNNAVAATMFRSSGALWYGRVAPFHKSGEKGASTRLAGPGGNRSVISGNSHGIRHTTDCSEP